jgi:hypothetical protein
MATRTIARCASGTLAPATLALLFLALALPTSDAAAQSAKDLVGSWTLVAIDNVRPDGSKIPLFGPSPQGTLMFDASGRYSIQICSTGRPKFASNDRTKGTTEENQAAVQGCNPHWGRYSVNAADRIILFQIDHATYTNWEGTEQKRSFTLTGDELKYSVPNPSATGANPVVIWRRAK